MNQQVSTLNLSVDVITKLENAGFYYCNDVKNNLHVLNKKVGLPDWSSVCKFPKPQTAFDLIERETNFQYVWTSILELDSILGSLLLPGCITEFCGYPGSGRTQICLYLAAGAGSKGQVVFIHTNKNLSNERLKEISVKFNSDYDAILENILCIEASNPLEFLASVHFLDGWLRESKNMRILIIDNIAWPLKQQGSLERTSLICRIFQELRSLANFYKFTIVITNDLTTRISEGQSYHTACFGDSFYHFINNRILLSKEGDCFKAKISKGISLDQEEIYFKLP